MSDYALVGKKGTGKSKGAVRLMRDRYFKRGYRVATNLDLNLEAMFGPRSRQCYVRVPDKPTAFDLMAAGFGNEEYDETKNGGLFLDELGTWLNSRSFGDKDRAGMLDFLAHGRKYGWDAYYIMQDIAQVDKQLRESFLEYTVRHIRFDRVRIPLIGGLLKTLLGERFAYLPRFHVAVTRLGTNPQDVICDRVAYRGDDLHACYDTRQVFRVDYPHGTHTVLSPWHVTGRYLDPVPPGWLQRLRTWLKGPPRRAPTVVSVPSPGWVRVRALCRNLPPDQALALLARYSRFVAKQGAPMHRGRGDGGDAPHGGPAHSLGRSLGGAAVVLAPQGDARYLR